MNYLLDTQLLLWTAYTPVRLSAAARAALEEDDASLIFSAASIWEVAIKRARNKPDFTAEPAVLRRALLDNGYKELPVTGAHAVALAGIAPLHKDPFDRLLLAQAAAEGFLLLTADAALAQYPGPVRLV